MELMDSQQVILSSLLLPAWVAPYQVPRVRRLVPCSQRQTHTCRGSEGLDQGVTIKDRSIWNIDFSSFWPFPEEGILVVKSWDG